MTDPISYGSLCTGYDGIGLGLALAGVQVEHRWMAEIEPSMGLVLKHEHPGVPNVGDLKTAPWQLAPYVQLLSSGDPCQSISIAGRQAGRADPRFLWPWVRDAYRVVRPGAIFFENVANIVSHDGGRTMAERFEHLRQDGYEVRWTVLGACAVGAPHHRHRWYAVAAYVGSDAPPARRIGAKAICGAPRSGGRFLLPTPDASMSTRGGLLSQPMALKRIADPTLSSNLDDVVASLLPTPIVSDATAGPGRTENREGGDDLRTIAARLLPTPMAERSGSNRGGSAGRGDDQELRPSLDGVQHLLPTPTTSNAHGNDVNNRGELLLPGIAARPDVWGKYAEAVALWEVVTGVPAPEPTEISPKGSRRLNPELPEWMMGLRPGMLTGPLDRADALRAAGNGVVPLAAAAAWRALTQ
jgi:DNA (cytosine-5)-methyltransferase 1